MRKIIRRLWYYAKKIPFVEHIYKAVYWNKKFKRISETHNQEIVSNGYSYISKVDKILQDSNAIYFVFAGTLLGLIRDGGFIKWDVDIDFGLVINDRFGWTELESLMHCKGYRKVREFKFNNKITEQTYMVDKLTIDFFGVFTDEKGTHSYSYDFIDDIKYKSIDEMSVYITSLPEITANKYIEICNTKIPVPDNAEKVLEAIYNQDWRIPNPNWKSNSGDNCELIQDMFGYREMYGGER